MQTVLLAGGKGTRLQPFTLNSPKPMYPIKGKPFLFYLLNQVKEFGMKDILLLLGYKASSIISYLEENPIPGINIEYSVTPVEFETGARLRAATKQIKSDFLLLYCDNFCPVSFSKHYEAFQSNDALVQLMAYSNRDAYTKNNLLVKDGKVIAYDKDRQTLGLNAVDIGYAIISRKILDWLPADDNLSFERYVYSKVLEKDRLFASVTEHRYYSIGSYLRVPMTESFFSNKKAVFLDRDGTLNVRPPKACYIETPKDFEWIPGAKEAIKKLNNAGYFVFVVTNQPGLARGRLTEETLRQIHQKMELDLKAIGAKIDKIYVCPHNWNEGCFCRKPSPGLLYEAQKEFDLNLPCDCVLFGDDDRDIEAASRAGCRAFKVTEDYPLFLAVEEFLHPKI